MTHQQSEYTVWEDVERDLSVLKWMVGANIALTLIVLGIVVRC